MRSETRFSGSLRNLGVQLPPGLIPSQSVTREHSAGRTITGGARTCVAPLCGSRHIDAPSAYYRNRSDLG
ncbi:hypothetical protein EVAR_55292_1 [Eumeta japonica]|uniref:Uncharacterized protein n=1 Tax=Eumeta variegata TaxID=151549 RepID=A0A4C1ZGT3_EUMVA|nr:hypothetical protein EVAR_55292_1 [Eumeta japonica]